MKYCSEYTVRISAEIPIGTKVVGTKVYESNDSDEIIGYVSKFNEHTKIATVILYKPYPVDKLTGLPDVVSISSKH